MHLEESLGRRQGLRLQQGIPIRSIQLDELGGQRGLVHSQEDAPTLARFEGRPDRTGHLGIR